MVVTFGRARDTNGRAQDTKKIFQCGRTAMVLLGVHKIGVPCANVLKNTYF